MSKMLRPIAFSVLVAAIVSPALIAVRAQNPPPPPPPARYYRENVDDGKGSVIRGRAFYQDSSAPVRRGWIGLVKIRELVVQEREGIAVRIGEGSGSGAENYVLTNDQGEFTMKGVKAGIYQAHFKVPGILNPTSSDRENPLYPPISIDGSSETTLQISALRGGSISGRVIYADGEPAIGARVQAVSKKDGEKNFRYGYGDDRTTTTTDDRGIYRFAGLPADDYFVRVIEPSVPNGSGAAISGYSIAAYLSNSALTTFYPGVSEIAEAKPLAVFAGQEQSDINILIADRRLFKISGTVTAKNTRMPLKDLKISFQKLSGAATAEQNFAYGGDSKQARTDEFGKWSFGDLPKGKYLIKVSNLESYEYNTNLPRPEAQPKFAPLTREIEIDNENPAEQMFEMASESVVSGTVTVEGDKGFPKYLALTALDEQSRVASSALIRNEGAEGKSQPAKINNSFRIGALAAGKYSLIVNTEPGFYIKSVRGGNSDLLNSTIEIADGQEISDVRVVLASDVGTLRGKIADYAPTDITFALLLPVGKSGSGILTNVRQATLNATGDFSAQAAPGEYYVIVVSNGDRPKDKKLTDWLIGLTADAPKATIKAGETATITINAPKN